MPTVQITLASDVVAAIAAACADAVVSLRVVIAAPCDALEATHLAVAAPVPAAPPAARGPLAELLRAGLLKSGDRLRMYQPRARRSAYANVHADGTLQLEDQPGTFTSPSAAASTVTGTQINGWTLWQREEDGQSLDQLRRHLRDGATVDRVSGH